MSVQPPPAPDAGGAVRPTAPLAFRPATFFPEHRHVVRADADEIAWDYLQQGGGLALGDVDGDGRDDLFASGGEANHRVFLQRDGGRFEEGVGVLPVVDGFVASATFADVDGDGDSDLVLSHVYAARGLTLLRNEGGVFADRTEIAGLAGFAPVAAWSTSFADIDRDGDLDFFVPQWVHWDTEEPVSSPRMFCNGGYGAFFDCSDASGMSAHFADRVDFGFTGTFADLDEDGLVDLLLAADFRRSHVFRGDGAGGFSTNPTTAFLAIEFGMGAVVADFDGDLHLDWFVTAIHFPFDEFNSNGNRLMLGDGQGALRDVTETAGVTDGGWGWAACAADFDLDGDVDVFHVNGYDERGVSGEGPFAELADLVRTDRSRFFLNDGGARFSDVAPALGLDDPAHLTATVCADLDSDGDVDIATLAVGGELRAYENTLGGQSHYLLLDLAAGAVNSHAVGARVTVTSAGRAQVAERRIANTHTSGQSLLLHFGLPAGDPVDVEVLWPDGARSWSRGLPVDRRHRLVHPGTLRARLPR